MVQSGHRFHASTLRPAANGVSHGIFKLVEAEDATTPRQ
jgi:hypothetical protein